MIEEGKNSIMEKEKVNSVKKKYIYNDNQLIEDKKREIRKLKRDRRSYVKKIKEIYTEKIRNNPANKKEITQNKNREINEYDEKIKELEKMNAIKYLIYLRDKEKKEKEEKKREKEKKERKKKGKLTLEEEIEERLAKIRKKKEKPKEKPVKIEQNKQDEDDESTIDEKQDAIDNILKIKDIITENKFRFTDFNFEKIN